MSRHLVLTLTHQMRYSRLVALSCLVISQAIPIAAIVFVFPADFVLLQVIAVVKGLTKTGITICATIHNPTPYCFNLFDRLMILLHGRVVYSGENGEVTGQALLRMLQPPPVCAHLQDIHAQLQGIMLSERHATLYVLMLHPEANMMMALCDFSTLGCILDISYVVQACTPSGILRHFQMWSPLAGVKVMATRQSGLWTSPPRLTVRASILPTLTDMMPASSGV